MASTTQIEWTDATWNPVTGCTKITRGCDFCYAERFSERFRGVPGHPFENGFDLKLRPERLTQPLSWQQPRRIFVNSMSDLFHKEIPRPFIDSVFDTMEAAGWHTFQVLTKRSSLMVRYTKLSTAIAPFNKPEEDFEIKTYCGEFENAIPEIQAFIGSSFPLIFIDPTGWKGYNRRNRRGSKSIGIWRDSQYFARIRADILFRTLGDDPKSLYVASYERERHLR
jgi:hypothetical protein